MKKIFVIIIFLLLSGCGKNDEITNVSDEDNSDYYGYLIIPSISMNLGFYYYDDDKNNVNQNVTLIKSNIENTFILAAHSGHGYLAYFNDLRYLKVNDEIILKFKNQENHYRIKRIRNEIKDGSINILNEKNQVILTTCNQVKKGYQLIVEASLVK